MQSKIVFLFVLSSHLLACRPPGRYVTDATPDTSSDDVSDVIVADRTDALLSNDATDVISAETTVEIATMEAAIDVAPDVIEMDASADTMEVGVDAMPDGRCPPPEAGVCPPLECREQLRIISTSTDLTLDCRRLWLLNEPAFITGTATVTVEPGTVVYARAGSALVFTRGTRLIADGTPTQPIIFTSNPSAPGGPGPWGGVHLLGNAPTTGGTALPYTEEQVGTSLPNWRAGGTDGTWNCGTLRYVRIQRSGGRFPGSMNDLDPLLLGGCGTQTTVDYVQVHQSDEHGIRVFGGSVAVKHLLVTYHNKHGFVWDYGWTGNAQHIAIIGELATGGSSDMGIQGSGSESRPTLSNVTIYNRLRDDPENPGIKLEGGTQGLLQNIIMVDQPTGAIDIGDSATMTQAQGLTPTLRIRNSLFFSVGNTGSDFFPAPGPLTPNEPDIFRMAGYSNRFGVNPMLRAPVMGLAPTLRPPAASPAASGGASEMVPGITTTSYIGAFAPSGTDSDWIAGWTTFERIR